MTADDGKPLSLGAAHQAWIDAMLALDAKDLSVSDRELAWERVDEMRSAYEAAKQRDVAVPSTE